MTANPELGPPQTEMINSKNKGSEQSNDAPTKDASPESESRHDENNSTASETMASPEEIEEARARRFWNIIKRPILRVVVGGSAMVVAGAAVTTLLTGGSEDKTENRSIPNNPSVTTEVETPPVSSPEITSGEGEVTYYPNGQVESSVEAPTPNFESKQFQIDPNRYIVAYDQFVGLPQAGESDQATLRNIFDSLSAASNALDEQGEGRPELIKYLMVNNDYAGSQGLLEIAAYSSKLTYDKETASTPHNITYLDFDLQDRSTSQYYPGATIYKVAVSGHILDANTGKSVFQELPFTTSLIVAPATKTYPDGSTQSGLELQQAWPEGQELPN